MSERPSGKRTPFDAWYAERAALNHDFLQNRLLTAIAGWLRRARKGEMLCADDLQTRLEVWPRYRDRLRAMIRGARAAARPSQLLDVPALSTLSGSHRGWLIPLLDGLAESRTGIAGRMRAVEDQLDLVDALLDGLCAGGRITSDRLEALYQATADMSRAISDLPSRLEL